MGNIAKRVDEFVGERIRRRRTQMGLTQHQLAGQLGISYQQVQKYETGANRVSAGRLFEIAVQMEIGIGFFFDGLEPGAPSNPLEHGGRQRAVIDVVRNFASIEDPQIRAAVAGLIRSLAGAEGEAEGESGSAAGLQSAQSPAAA